jgi:toxin ParE1/3/4
MAKLEWSDEAFSDLAHWLTEFGAHSPKGAARIACDLDEALDLLRDHPERGRLGDAPGTRELTTVPPLVVVYEIRGEALFILRVWHGRQGIDSGRPEPR